MPRVACQALKDTPDRRSVWPHAQRGHTGWRAMLLAVVATLIVGCGTSSVAVPSQGSAPPTAATASADAAATLVPCPANQVHEGGGSPEPDDPGCATGNDDPVAGDAPPPPPSGDIPNQILALDPRMPDDINLFTSVFNPSGAEGLYPNGSAMNPAGGPVLSEAGIRGQLGNLPEAVV